MNYGYPFEKGLHAAYQRNGDGKGPADVVISDLED